MEEYIGIIKLFAGGFIPKGWLACDGSVLSASTYAALGAVLGNKYGGTAPGTFALPDLRGCIPVGMGQGPGLSAYVLGQKGGSETAAMTVANLPQHTHSISGSVNLMVGSGPAETDSPVGTYLALSSQNTYYFGGAAVQGDKSPDLDVNLELSSTGSGTPFDINPPYLGLQYIICAQGIFPPQGSNN